MSVFVRGRNSHYVGIHANDGAGVLTPGPSITIAGSYVKAPGPVAVADFDGDGDLDLAVVSASSAFNSSDIVVGLNDGSARFSSGSVYTTTTYYVADLAAGDFTGDGVSDLAAVTSGNLLLLANDGTGTAFGAPVFSTPGGARLVASDFDGDGDLDVAVTSGTSVSIFSNNGTGTFTKTSCSTSAPGAIAAADLDGDGAVDLVVARSTAAVAILRNDGSGVFTPSSDISVSVVPRALVATDLNRDLRVDLVVLGDSTFDVLHGK